MKFLTRFRKKNTINENRILKDFSFFRFIWQIKNLILMKFRIFIAYLDALMKFWCKKNKITKYLMLANNSSTNIILLKMQDTAGEAGTNSLAMYSYGPPHMAEQKQDDQHDHTFSNYVRIRDVAQKTCQRRWTIGKSGERGWGISVLPAQHDDDDIYIQRWKNIRSSKNDFIYIIICQR